MEGSKTVPVVVMQGMRHVYWLKSEGDRVHEGESIASMEAGDESKFGWPRRYDGLQQARVLYQAVGVRISPRAG